MTEAAAKRLATEDTTKSEKVLRVVSMIHVEDGCGSHTQENLCSVPAEWLDGIDGQVLTVRANNDSGDVSVWQIDNRDHWLKKRVDDNDNDDDGGDGFANDKARALAARFVNKDNLPEDNKLALWPNASTRVARLLMRDFEFEQRNAIADRETNPEKRKKAITALKAELPDLALKEVEKRRADGTLHKCMVENDDMVSSFFAPKGCTPIDTNVSQPKADLTLFIVLTFT